MRFSVFNTLFVLPGILFAQSTMITPVRVLPNAAHTQGGSVVMWNKTQTYTAGFTTGGQTYAADQVWQLPTSDVAGCLGSDGAYHLSFGNCTATRLVPPSGTTQPIIDATSLAGPLTIRGANSVNGNVLIQPGAVSGAASLFVESSRLDWPGIIIREASGTTTGNAFELWNNSGTLFFKIIGSTTGLSASQGAVVARSIFPNSTTVNAFSIGDTNHRYQASFGIVSVAGSGAINGYLDMGDRGDGCCTQIFMRDNGFDTHLYSDNGGNFSIHKYGTGSVGGPALTITNGGTTTVTAGDLLSGANKNLGNTSSGYFNHAYFSGNVEGTRMRMIYGTPASITDLFDFYTSGPADFRLSDSSGNIVYNYTNQTTPFHIFRGDVIPSANNTYDNGNPSYRWKKLWGVDADISGTLTCSSSCGFLSLTGGTMTGDILVSGSHDLGTPAHPWATGYIASAKIGISLAYLTVNGSGANIDGSTLGGALNINGSTTTNGNIVLNPGNVASLSSVYVNGHNGGSTSDQTLQLNEVSGTASGIDLRHGGALDATWQADSFYALDVFGSAGTHKLVVTQGGNMGIGTSGPDAELEVVSASTVDPRGVVSSGYGSATAAEFLIRKANGTRASPTALTTGTLGVILFSGWNGSSWQYPAYLTMEATVSGSNIGGTYKFATRNSSGGALTERFAVTGVGGVEVLTGSLFSVKSGAASSIEVDWLPATTNTYSLGSALYRWLYLYPKNIDVPNSGLVLFNSTSSAQFNSGSYLQMQPGSSIVFGSGSSTQGNLVSNGNLTDNLGASGNAYGKLWVKSIDLDSSGLLSLNGAVNTDILFSGNHNLGSSGTPVLSAYITTLNSTTGIFSGTVTTDSVILTGSAPQIDASGLGAALNINGSGSGNGNIVLNPGNVTSLSSVYVNGHNNGSTTTQTLVLNESSGGGSGVTLTHGGTFDAAWQAGSGAAFDVVSNNASSHRFVVLHGGQVLVARTSDNGTGAIFQVQGSISSSGGYIANGSTGQSVTITVRDAAGTGTCTIIYTNGIKTGGTC